MMTRPFAILLSFFLTLISICAQDAEKDTGKEKVGRIQATLYIGTDEDVAKLGDKAKKSPLVAAATAKRFRSIEKMNFKHYRTLGKDTQTVFRSYENWVSPLKPSEEILLSFESRGRTKDGGLRLDLEFWQQHRKVMKSDPVLYLGKPLFILGPKWRGGTLIIAVELVELVDSTNKQ